MFPYFFPLLLHLLTTIAKVRNNFQFDIFISTINSNNDYSKSGYLTAGDNIDNIKNKTGNYYVHKKREKADAFSLISCSP